jgi:lipopolysaccharide transport system permease protein
MKYISSIYWYIEIVFYKASLNLKSEISRNTFAYLWWILEPLIYLLVFYLVFGVLLQRGGPDYVPFLLIGLTIFMWFSKSISGCASSIISHNNLINSILVPYEIFPMITVTQVTLKHFFSFVAMFMILYILEIRANIDWMNIIFLFILQYIILLDLAFIVSLMVVYLRDIKFIIPSFLTLLMFGSGIFYDYKLIDQNYHFIFELNPLSYLVTGYRDIILHNAQLNSSILILWYIASIVFFLLSVIVYKIVGSRIPLRVSQ